MSQTVKVGIAGFGYWGPKLLRNLVNSDTTTVVGVCDVDGTRRETARRFHPDVPVVTTFDELLALDGLEAVAIATPVSTHHALVNQALGADKHVLVTKPLAQTLAQAVDLARRARQRNRVLFVDHTFLFTPAVRKLREMIRSGDLGTLLYYDSIRVNLGLFQSDVDVIQDLAPHDFSILDYVLEKRPLAVAAIGRGHATTGFVDVAYVTLDYGNELLAHCHLNWLAPKKVRSILIGGSRRMVSFDDVEPDEKIRVYDRGIEERPVTITPDDREGRYQTLISYRTGDMHAPWLDRTEALFTECRAFGHAVQSGIVGDGDAMIGVRVVAMLDAAKRSLESGGGFVPVDWEPVDALP